MRAVLQRTREAAVRINGELIGEIGPGLLVLLGIGEGDTEKEMTLLSEKMVNLRIFEDEAGKMNRSLLDVEGEILLVSQFTLFADCKKGRRPSFTGAARPEEAIPLYEGMKEALLRLGVKRVASGVFGADMAVSLINDGPVTILLDTMNL